MFKWKNEYLLMVSDKLKLLFAFLSILSSSLSKKCITFAIACNYQIPGIILRSQIVISIQSMINLMKLP